MTVFQRRRRTSSKVVTAHKGRDVVASHLRSNDFNLHRIDRLATQIERTISLCGNHFRPLTKFWQPASSASEQISALTPAIEIRDLSRSLWLLPLHGISCLPALISAHRAVASSRVAGRARCPLAGADHHRLLSRPGSFRKPLVLDSAEHRREHIQRAPLACCLRFV